MEGKTVMIEDIIPVEATCGDCLIGNRGDVTIGWELALPQMYSLTGEDYDALLSGMMAAARMLDPWTVIHRQDVYTYRTYEPEDVQGYLGGCYERHFAGRPYLSHSARLFITMASRQTVMGSSMGKMLCWSRRSDARFPTLGDLESFRAKAERFVSSVTAGGKVRARLLTEADYRGTDTRPGMIQRHLMLDAADLQVFPICGSQGIITVGEREAVAFSVPSSSLLPVSVDSVVRTEGLSTSDSPLHLSLGSRFGLSVPCDHVVNLYVATAPQDSVISDLEDMRKRMEGGFSAAENRVSAEELSTYIDRYWSESLTTVWSHASVIAWDRAGRTESLVSRLASAFSAAGIAYCRNTSDPLTTLMASCPGGETELGGENWMLSELGQALSFCCWETSGAGIPGGLVKLCDRTTGVPVRLDLQAAARSWLNTLNYNIFLLGPSGSGKSFTTNLLMRSFWEAGEQVYIIDVGGSYEGLCGTIRELSGGADGVYHTWDSSHPFSFNPFTGWRSWGSEDSNGHGFMLSLLMTLWQPDGGWTEGARAVLESMIDDFLDSWQSERDPLFGDLVDWLGTVARPQVLSGDYWCGYSQVSPSDFDINSFLAPLRVFARDGRYGFLLNNPDPPDLFTSRFVVFEVDALAQKGNELLYSVCMLCIMNSFDDKIRRSDGFKVLCIEEAWQAVSKDFMAEYLRGLWKTARKYRTSAMVVSQEIADISSSPVMRDTILANSSVKMILTQEGRSSAVATLRDVMGFTDLQSDLIMSVGRGVDPSSRCKEVFISWDGKMCGVWRVEASPEEGYAYESERERKRPLMERAAQLGSLKAAMEEFRLKGVVL